MQVIKEYGAGGWAGGTAPLTLILDTPGGCVQSSHCSAVTKEPPPVIQRRFARFWEGKSVAPRGIRTPISQSSGACSVTTPANLAIGIKLCIADSWTREVHAGSTNVGPQV